MTHSPQTPFIQRPQDGEYGAFYAVYIQHVPDGDIFDLLESQMSALREVLAPINNTQADFRYAPDQWSIKEMLGHINDTERVFSYRALRISRNDKSPLEGFDQDEYVKEAFFSQRTLADLLDEFEHLRRANLLSFRAITSEVSERVGIASGYPVSVRALLYMMVGHVIEHIKSLKTEYLPALA